MAPPLNPHGIKIKLSPMVREVKCGGPKVLCMPLNGAFLFLIIRNMGKVAKSLAFFALLLLLATWKAAPVLAEKIAYFRPFDDVRREMLEADLPSIGHSLSPYQLWLIHFWRGEYVWLLDADTFTNAVESWKQSGSRSTVDLSGLFYDTRYYYFDGYFGGDDNIVSRIRNTDLALYEKDFLELFLRYILSQGKGEFWSGYQLNGLAETYLSKYPDSPYRRFVESTIHADLPPLLWYSGASFGIFEAIPMGGFGNYFSSRFGLLYELPIFSFRNIVLTPSFTFLDWGTVRNSFSYNGERFSGMTTAYTLDLSLGYRFNLLREFAILPQGGLGLLNIQAFPKDEDSLFLGFTPTASLGVVFEFSLDGAAFGKTEAKGGLSLGIAYRSLIHSWEDRFEGSELVFSLSSQAFLSL